MSDVSNKLKIVVATVATVVGVTISKPTNEQTWAQAEKINQQRIVQNIKTETIVKNQPKTSQGK